MFKINPFTGELDNQGKSTATLDLRYLKLTGSLAEVSNHSHTVLTDIGTNTHAQIDTFIGTTVPATYAPLASPVFTTQITTPLVVGGAGTTSDLNLKTTSGVGATGADMHFLVGNNGATEAMTILNDGTIGIGTATPVAGRKLEILGDNNQIIINTQGRYNSLYFLNDGVAAALMYSDNQEVKFKFRTYNDYPIVFMPNGAEKMVIDKDGNVGIGTTDPGALLELNTTTAGTPVSVLKLKNSNAAYQAAGMEFLSSLGGGTGMQNVGRIYGIATAEDWTTTRVTIQVPDGGGTLVDALTIRSSKVGIGTVTPDAKLHVVGTNTGVGLVRINNSGGSAGDMNGIDFYNAGNLQAFIRSQIADGYPTKLFLGTAAGQNNAATKVTIDSAGNVGIGIDAPTAKLHIDQSVSDAAKPVLTVDQADVSEEFIKFIGTSTTDASQSLVDAADMATPGSIVGWLKIYVQDDQATNPIADGAYYLPFYSAPSA